MIRTIALIAFIATPASAADFEFCRFGNNGFVIEGRMSVPDGALSAPRISEDDVTGFSITGRLNGVPIGSWSLNDLTPTTPWNLNFDPASMTFVTGGLSSSDTGQQWNANGSVNDCGADGFGFNSGSGGQNVCVKNTYRTDSTIDPLTDFPVYLLGTGPACTSAPLLGAVHTLTPPTQM